MGKQARARVVTFRYRDPTANAVSVCGTFCDWRPQAHPLTKDKKGLWTTKLSLPPGRYEYRFFVDGEWRDDPSAVERTPNPFGSDNCVLHMLHESVQKERAKVGSEGVP